MAEIIKFVCVMILFLSLFLVVAEDIEGKPSVYPSQIFFFTS